MVPAGSAVVARELRDNGDEVAGLRAADAAVTDGVCFLLSAGASFVNGEALVLTALGETTQESPLVP